MSSQNLSTVDRVMRLLFHLAESPPLTVIEVAEHLRIPTSTAYRYIASLKAYGLVSQHVDSRYSIGPRCVQLEASFQRQFEANSSCQEIMSSLAIETGETVAFVVPLKHEAVCVATVESEKPLRYTFRKGAAAPMLRGASAKAFLPWLDDSWVQHLIDVSDDIDDGQKDQLRAELAVIKERGYALSHGEVDEGVWTVGAPVFGSGGKIEGAISTIAPMFRVRDEQDRLIVKTVAAARRMSDMWNWEMKYAV